VEPKTGVDPHALLEHKDFVRGIVRRLLAPGKWTVLISKDGYGIRSVRDLEFTAGAQTLDFELDPAATLQVQVTDRAGRPVVGRVFLGFHSPDKTSRTSGRASRPMRRDTGSIGRSSPAGMRSA